jgi:glycosyltransferase involved in cell wall biosynthesis
MLGVTYSIADQNVATTKSIGIYNLSTNLARNLSEQPQLERLTVFSNETVSPSLALTSKARIEEYNYPVRSRWGRILWDQWSVYQRARAAGNPWLFLPKGFCSFLARPPVQVAAYVHDIMGDFYNRNYPNFSPRLEAQYFARSLAATICQSSVIFTNSEFSKSELLEYTRRKGMRQPKVIVAGYGFRPVSPEPVQKQNRVLLFASSMPHKQTKLATHLLTHWLGESKFTGVIDCIGIIAPGMETPQGSRWNWMGRVPPGKGRELIRRARAVVYSSEYEGFGMPPVEAVLEGTCPVFSDIPPLRETMGAAGCAFSNDSEASFLAAMNRALTIGPETLGSWAQTLLQRHNWLAVSQRIMGELLGADGVANQPQPEI